MNRCAVLILAAGRGTRMRSEIPKILHPLAGLPLLQHVLTTARTLSPEKLVVVTGHQSDIVQSYFSDQTDILWALQQPQLGTGHAVQVAMPNLNDFDGELLVLCGDVPLLPADALHALLDQHRQQKRAASVLTTHITPPDGYGRIVRAPDQSLDAIVEHKDADAETLCINEINSGIYCFSMNRLQSWLSNLSSNNAQGEYYLTDVIAMANQEAKTDTAEHNGSGAYCFDDAILLSGINDRVQLSVIERTFRDRHIDALMRSGVTFRDPSSCWVAADSVIGPDTTVEPNVILGPGVQIGSHCHIGPFCQIQDARIGDHCQVHAFSHLDGADLAGHNAIGPYTRLRPGADIAEKAKVGNFCEVKKAHIGQGSKVNHLSYVGDAQIGTGVNIGAGTITCNYDGVNKHQTIIGNNVFVGSGTQLVAPVTVGDKAVIGAGSTVTKDIPEQALALSRTPQKHIANWASRKKK
ncbi:MAG: bifunctional UDP-N-acetylglucosamine diphosphorylase/glucosamine-1-phosphate N-acetyltransferase GlmU [Magnetococcales bacterium]|nr:bifunctional UDP-N-acetylglucosamine diphosphorylase/glucosamine-1-phosphate N-acetyltransferase GlmU [Magnetococcales bacterium]